MFQKVRCSGLSYLFVCLCLTLWGGCTSAFTQVTGWGEDSSGSISGVSGATNVKQVAAGDMVTIVLYTDGSLGAFGDDQGLGTVTDLPSGSNYTQIACNFVTAIALKD